MTALTTAATPGINEHSDRARVRGDGAMGVDEGQMGTRVSIADWFVNRVIVTKKNQLTTATGHV